MAKNVLCLCNPLLDISVEVPATFLERYKLLPGNAILADPSLHGPAFFQELAADPNVKYIAGGSAMNTARVCSWILQTPKTVSYLGAVGKDSYAKLLTEGAKRDGVDVEGILEVADSTPTGLCGVCIVGKERSLVAALDAANKFTFDHMLTPAVQQRIKASQIMYVSGFHLTVCFEAIMLLARHAAENSGKIFTMNMSAPFIMAVFKEQLLQLLPLCDIIFCNEDEAKGLGAMLGYGDALSVTDIAKRIIDNKVLKQSGRNLVVFTQGKDPTVLQSAEEGQVLVTVQKIESDKIVDTNGAGDAFVGGFLAALAQGKSLRRCAQVGNYAAGVVIQHSGCQFPPTPVLPAE